MTVYIISAVLVVLALIVLLIFTLNVKIGLKYSTVTGSFFADASVLFIHIPLYPPKKNNKAKRKKQSKQKTKNKKASRQKQKLKENLSTAAREGHEAAENNRNESLSQKAHRLAGLFKHLAISLRELAPGILGAITLDIKKLDICVGAEDAADAAISYGVICGGVEMLMALENDCKKLVVSEAPNVVVDFTSPRIHAEAELIVSVRAYKILFALYRAEDAYYTYSAGL